jgi:hypothetical protein
VLLVPFFLLRFSVVASIQDCKGIPNALPYRYCLTPLARFGWSKIGLDEEAASSSGSEILNLKSMIFRKRKRYIVLYLWGLFSHYSENCSFY